MVLDHERWNKVKIRVREDDRKVVCKWCYSACNGNDRNIAAPCK